MDDPAPHSSPLTRRRLIAVFKTAYGVAVAAVLAWALWQAWQNPDAWNQLRRSGALVFVGCWVALPTVLGLAWARVLDAYLGIRLPASQWLPIQGAAWAGRYLPGKLGLLAGRMTLLTREDVNMRGLSFSVLFEQIAFVVTGVAVALIATLPIKHFAIDLSFLPLGGGWQQALRVAIAGLLCVTLFPILNVFAGRLAVTGRPPLAGGMVILVLYLAAHALAGAGLYFALQDILPQAGPNLPYVISLVAAANVAGILAIFAPAGLGVREAVLVAGLSPYLPVTEALSLAAALRVLTLLADLIFVAGTGGVLLLTRRSFD